MSRHGSRSLLWIVGVAAILLAIPSATAAVSEDRIAVQMLEQRCENTPNASYRLGDTAPELSGDVVLNGQSVDTVDCQRFDQYSFDLDTATTTGRITLPAWTLVFPAAALAGILVFLYRRDELRDGLATTGLTAGGIGIIWAIGSRWPSTPIPVALVLMFAPPLTYIVYRGHQEDGLISLRTGLLLLIILGILGAVAAAILAFVGIPVGVEMQQL